MCVSILYTGYKLHVYIRILYTAEEGLLGRGWGHPRPSGDGGIPGDWKEDWQIRGIPTGLLRRRK